MTKPEQHMYDLLVQIYMFLDDGDRHLLQKLDLTVPRFYLLFHLGENPGLTPHELSGLMFCDKSNITRLVQQLDKRELIEKRPHESDGRSFRLYLTEAGDKLRQEAINAHEAFNHTRFATLLSQQEALEPLLMSIHRHLSQQTPD